LAFVTLTLVPIGYALAAPIGSSATVIVGGRTTYDGTGVPPVDSGLELDPGQCVQLRVYGYMSPHPGTQECFPNEWCFHGEFFDPNNGAIELRTLGYPVPLRCRGNTNCSLFHPIGASSTLAVDDPNPRLDQYVSIPLPVPPGAVGLRFSQWDSYYDDNGGQMTVTTTVVRCP